MKLPCYKFFKYFSITKYQVPHVNLTVKPFLKMPHKIHKLLVIPKRVPRMIYLAHPSPSAFF